MNKRDKEDIKDLLEELRDGACCSYDNELRDADELDSLWRNVDDIQDIAAKIKNLIEEIIDNE